MRRVIVIMIAVSFCMLFPVSFAGELDFTESEIQWLADHQNDVFKLGLNPDAGMDFFYLENEVNGYVLDLVDLIEHELSLNVEIVGDESWAEVYQGLIDGKVDILFGANETPERQNYMAFTRPVYENHYAVFTLKDKDIKTLGDLDGKRVGFLESDVIIELLPSTYKNIDVEAYEYHNQLGTIDALIDGKVDGIIISGSSIKQDLLCNYDDVTFIVELNTITSDMTLSTRKEDEMLAGILDKFIAANREEIDTYIRKAEIEYNKKILKFTADELQWLENDGVAVVGVADDYLPFDYYQDGRYMGIAGEVLNEIGNVTGIEFEVVHGSFNDMYEMAMNRDVDLLNMAKTRERLEHFTYPRPFSTERDIVVGRKESPRVHDVYGLEGKRVAVIEGFWHEEYLLKNLKDVEIVFTKDIMASLELLESEKVDYLIENPTVVSYYIEGLGYNNLVKKGDTSRDSFLYFGVAKEEKELASIIDKSMALIDYSEMKYKGIETVPILENKTASRLTNILFFTVVILTAVTLVLVKIVNMLIDQKAQTKILMEREHLLYTDALTDVHNRMYLNHIEESLEAKPLPQSIIMTDLNNLKVVNDSYGHHLGDELIIRFAQILVEHCHKGVVFRMGGDEFLIFLPETGREETEDVLRKIKRACGEPLVSTEDHDIDGPSSAYGYHIRTSSEESLYEAVKIADKNMYENKKEIKLRG